MTQDEVRRVCTERLALWVDYLSRQHATPFLAIGVGHDDVSGVTFLATAKNASTDDVIAMLRGALAILEQGACLDDPRPVNN
jgi:hypothetical protein